MAHKHKKSVITKTTPPPENTNSYWDIITGTNSSNDMLILRQNVEIYSKEYFSYDVISGIKLSTKWNSQSRTSGHYLGATCQLRPLCMVAFQHVGGSSGWLDLNSVQIDTFQITLSNKQVVIKFQNLNMLLPQERYVLSEIFVIVRRFSQKLQAHKSNITKREKLARHPRTIWRI